MRLKGSQRVLFRRAARCLVAIVASLLLAPGDALWSIPLAQASGAQQGQPTLPPDQLDALVAPIALYPDALLSQALVASTYPLEIVQLQQWMAANKNLKDKALTDAVMKQNWDPSVQALALYPDMMKQLADNIKWTTDLGNAVLAQQSDILDAVQRMRTKAQGNGNLKTTEQQKVETKVVENKQVIVIEPSNPEVVYVPSYNPTVVYGPPVYPYPPIAYPPPGYYAAGMAISFGVGMMVGAAWGGGWGCGWGGHNNIYINNNNNFVRNSNIQGGNRIQGGDRNRVNPQGNSNWQHNSQHRGGAPYGDRATANQYGGATRNPSSQNLQSSLREGMSGGNRPSAGTMDRGGARGGQPSAGTMDRGANRGATSGGIGAGGGDRVGNRSVPNASSRGSGGAFGGGGASAARASSSRGASSFGGGGGRGGGMRGGGGRRR